MPVTKYDFYYNIGYVQRLAVFEMKQWRTKFTAAKSEALRHIVANLTITLYLSIMNTWIYQLTVTLACYRVSQAKMHL